MEVANIGLMMEKKCAIGRYIPDGKYHPKIEGCSVRKLLQYDILPENIIELGTGFLAEVQYLHDGNDNWCEKGLSFEGNSLVDSIKSRYINN